MIYQPTAPRHLSQLSPASGSAADFRGIRPRILEAALSEFAEKGYEDASLTGIARKVGVTAPLILYHFGSKANLWKDAMEIQCVRLDCVVVTALEDSSAMSGRNALRMMIRRLVQFSAANPAMHRLLTDDAMSTGPHADWLSATHLAPVFAKIESVFNRAVDEGCVRPMPFELALFMILGAASQYLDARKMAEKVFSRCELRGQWTSRNDYIEQVLDFCFAGLAAHGFESMRPAAPQPMAMAV